MSDVLNSVRSQMAGFLKNEGLPACCAWPEGGIGTTPMVVVSLRNCQTGPGGFHEYLGERMNQELGLWEELYGRKARITLGLDICAGAELGEHAIETTYARLVEALSANGSQGLLIQEVTCGETVYDKAARMLKRSVQAVYTAYLYAVMREDGTFIDFEIKGGVRQ